jgi:hypothetical protein
MDADVLERFAEQLSVDPTIIEDRWAGRPDLLAEDIFRVKDIDTGEVRDLELWDPQRKALHAYFYGPAQTINNYKGRRIGYSFIYSLAFLLEGIFIPNSYYPFVSRQHKQSKARIREIKELIENAKVEIPAPVKNRDYIELWNGSAFEAYTSDSDGARGDKPARAVLLDEQAFMEDQKKVLRAFGAFRALGKNRKLIQVSTPLLANDLFMQTHARGTESGLDEDGNPVGVISIKQPSFYNADEIDIHTPLTEQHVEPVRPDMNIAAIEEDRAADPEGFAQEYLCRPVVDAYRFFDSDSITRAMNRGADEAHAHGLTAPKAGFRAIGVDIGIDHDDTVAVVFDHVGSRRLMRHIVVIDDAEIGSCPAPGLRGVIPDRGNAAHVAEYLAWLVEAIGADLLVLDKTGPGETFARQIEAACGSAVLPFNFSDKKAVNKMMGDMNNALRNDRVTLLPDERFRDELGAIVKEKMRASLPRFSGKDNSKSGKDDAAMAAVLAAFPPGYTTPPSEGPAYKERDEPTLDAEGESSRRRFSSTHGSPAPATPEYVQTAPTAYKQAFGATTISRSSRAAHGRRYHRRYSR